MWRCHIEAIWIFRTAAPSSAYVLYPQPPETNSPSPLQEGERHSEARKEFITLHAYT